MESGVFSYQEDSANDLTSLPARSEPETGDGRYLGDMSLSQPESVRLVEQALLEGPAEGMTGNQVWEALDRAVPEHTVRLMLGGVSQEADLAVVAGP